MKIIKDEFAAIQRYLENERWAGNEYVAFPDDNFPAGKEQLPCFRNEFDARQYCHDMTTDIDRHSFLPLRSVCKTMREAAADPALLIASNGLVNLQQMVQARWDKLEKEQMNVQSTDLTTFKNEYMNQKNFDYLKDNLLYTGFAAKNEGEREQQHQQLETKLKEGKDSFTMNFSTEIGKKKFDAELRFGKSKDTDLYFFNNYKATLERGDGKTVERTFYLDEGKGVTAKEAFNLLDGRAVHKKLTDKEGEPYTAWLQLNFEKTDKHNNFEMTQFHANYGYNLKEAMSKLAVKNMDGGAEETKMLKSLEKGNIYPVTFDINGKEQKMLISANPQYKTVNLYDEKLRAVMREDMAPYLSNDQKKNDLKQSQESEKADQKQSQKQGKKKDNKMEGAEGGPKEKKQRKPRQGLSM